MYPSSKDFAAVKETSTITIIGNHCVNPVINVARCFPENPNSANKNSSSVSGRVVVRNPTKESAFSHPKGVSEIHLEFIEDFGTFVEGDDLGFGEKFQLSSGILENLTKSENPRISLVAKEIEEIVHQNMSKILQDEIEALRSTGVYAISRFMEINYFIDTGRVSLIWRGKINRKKDVMRTALQMLPDDIRKSAKVEEWIDFHPKLRLEVEQKLDDSDRSYRNAQ